GIGESYQVSTVAYKKYPRNQIPSDEVLVEDLKNLFTDYQKYVEATISKRPVFRYTMAHIYYGQGILNYLKNQPEQTAKLEKLIDNQEITLKSGSTVEHPQQRIRLIGRALEEMGLLKINEDIYSLSTTLGLEYSEY